MKRKRGTKSQNGGVPKRGDPDYLTPTQLRNRRKRRAKQQQQQRRVGIDVVDGGTSSSNGNDVDVDVVGGRLGGRGGSDRGKGKEGVGRMGMVTEMTIDPSMAYITNPTNAPIVDAARRYLEPILRLRRCEDRVDDDDIFRVHLGPVHGWRTVSKLAVRPAENSAGEKPSVAIGMFLPKSHRLLPVPNCMAHHPSINVAVNCIETACHEIGVLPYVEGGREDVGGTVVDGVDDEYDGDDASRSSMGRGMIGKEGGGGGGGDVSSAKGGGRLRYVSINVARDTGGAQITLVWNSPPPPPPPPPPPTTTTFTSSCPPPIPTDDGISERKFDARTAGIIDPDLNKLVARLISMSCSANISSSDVVVVAVGDEPEGRGDPSTRKRRRRGRQEGGRSAMRDDGASSSDAIAARKGRVDVVGNDGDDDRAVGCGDDGGPSRLRSTPSDARGGGLNLHSVWINYNRSCRHSNAIFAYDPDCWRHVHGPRSIIEYLDLAFGPSCDAEDDAPGGRRGRTLAIPRPTPFPIPLHFPPNVFRQANLDAFAGIVGRIRNRIARDIVRENDDVSCVELYGGVGTIGLHLSDVVSSLVCSDENPNNERCFNDSVRALPGHIRSRLAYRRKNAADMIKTELPLIRKCRVLIVDPPRKGLDIEVVDYLCQEGRRDNIGLVAYVSCGFRAFQRDCDALMRSGQWKVAFAEGYLLFPGSDAIETLAFFVPS